MISFILFLSLTHFWVVFFSLEHSMIFPSPWTNETFDQMASRYMQAHSYTQITTVTTSLRSPWREENQHHFQIGHNKVVNFVLFSCPFSFSFSFHFICFFVFVLSVVAFLLSQFECIQPFQVSQLVWIHRKQFLTPRMIQNPYLGFLEIAHESLDNAAKRTKRKKPFCVTSSHCIQRKNQLMEKIKNKNDQLRSMIMIFTSVHKSIECMLWILIFFTWWIFPCACFVGCCYFVIVIMHAACAIDKSINAKYERQ